jgi:hypothetical protein
MGYIQLEVNAIATCQTQTDPPIRGHVTIQVSEAVDCVGAMAKWQTQEWVDNICFTPNLNYTFYVEENSNVTKFGVFRYRQPAKLEDSIVRTYIIQGKYLGICIGYVSVIP